MASHSIQKSLKTLSGSLNPAASEILLQSLVLPDEPTAQAAAAAILDSGKQETLVQVVRQWRTWPSSVKDVFLSSVSRMGHALEACLADEDEQVQLNALEYLRLTDAFDLFPHVLSLLKQTHSANQKIVAHTMFSLVDRLYQHCSPHASSENTTHLRNAVQIQHRVLTALTDAVSDLNSYSYRDTIVESLVILSSADNPVLESLLTVQGDQVRELTRKVLGERKHPGVLRCLTDSLSLNFPKPELLSVVQQRTDTEFLTRLMNWVPLKFSSNQSRNLQQFDSFAWMKSLSATLKQIPRELQQRVIPLMEATSIPPNEIEAAKMWLLTMGTAEARESVSSLLETLDPEIAEEVLKRALKHTDEKVRAWAAKHLREQTGAAGVTELIDQLQSDSEVVRETARAQLSDFTMSHFLDLYETMDANSCKHAGELLQQIDPECVQKLRTEIECPIHQRKLKGIRASESFGLQEEVVDSLLEVLTDPDVMLRRAAVEVLGTVPQIHVVQALYNLLEDPSPRVRETVTSSLKQLVSEHPSLLGETHTE